MVINIPGDIEKFVDNRVGRDSIVTEVGKSGRIYY